MPEQGGPGPRVGSNRMSPPGAFSFVCVLTGETGVCRSRSKLPSPMMLAKCRTRTVEPSRKACSLPSMKSNSTRMSVMLLSNSTARRRSLGGAGTTTPFGPMPSAGDRPSRKPSSQWTGSRLCTNNQAGPPDGGSSAHGLGALASRPGLRSDRRQDPLSLARRGRCGRNPRHHRPVTSRPRGGPRRYLTYIVTAMRMISRLVLKQRKGFGLLMRPRYDRAGAGSSEFRLTAPTISCSPPLRAFSAAPLNPEE